MDPIVLGSIPLWGSKLSLKFDTGRADFNDIRTATVTFVILIGNFKLKLSGPHGLDLFNRCHSAPVAYIQNEFTCLDSNVKNGLYMLSCLYPE